MEISLRPIFVNSRILFRYTANPSELCRYDFLQNNLCKRLYNYITFIIFAMKRIYAYKDCFSKLMQTLNDIERKKIKRALLLLETEDKIPYHYIKYLMDGIYELRVTCGYNEFRIMFIHDGNDVVILLNAFRKKTQKTPKNELERAIRLKNEYYGQKEQ